MKKAYPMFAITALCIFVLVSCAPKKDAKKPAAKNPVVSKKTETDAIIKKVKEMYICPQNNISLADSEARGALCPEGAKMLEVAKKMAERGMSADDIYYIVSNHKLQGVSIVQDNGNPACVSAGRLKMEFFIMSYCPFGVRFFDTVLKDMTAALGTYLDWKPYYILSLGQDGKLQSMHGPKEVEEDLRQICIRDKQGTQKWMEYMNCFSAEVFAKSKTPEAKDWKFCAAKAGLNAAEIQSCVSNEGVRLAMNDVNMSQRYGANASPTAVYNCSKNIVGAMPFTDIKTHVCKLMPQGSEMPPACMTK